MEVEDIIYAAKYAEMCDYSYEGQSDLPSGIINVDAGAIPEFFKAIQNNGKRYIVVSPSSDFGLCYQRYNHPALDLKKWAGMVLNNKHGYQDLYIPARINKKRCNPNDTYSLKCWAFTEATFDEIPNNVVHWFISNCEVENSRITPIPLGVFGNKDVLESVRKIAEHPRNLTRDKTLYVNFQFYTTDRLELYHYFKQFETVTCKRDVSFDEYLNDLASHKFVLCPPGNGYDTYRSLETIYMGAIPIFQNGLAYIAPYTTVMYPISRYNSLFAINPTELEYNYNNIMQSWKNNINLEKVCWPYWKNRIESFRSLIGQSGSL